MTRLLRHDQPVPREDGGAVFFDDVLEEFNKKKFDDALQWPMDAWISLLVKGGGPKKRFRCCLFPNSSKHFLYLRAIQGHSGVMRLSLSCKTMYCNQNDLLSTSTTSGV